MFSVKNQNKRMIDLRGVCLCLPVVRSTIEAFLGIHERKRKQLVQKMTRPVILRTTFLTLKSPNKCPKLVIYLLSPVSCYPSCTKFLCEAAKKKFLYFVIIIYIFTLEFTNLYILL